MRLSSLSQSKGRSEFSGWSARARLYLAYDVLNPRFELLPVLAVLFHRGYSETHFSVIQSPQKLPFVLVLNCCFDSSEFLETGHAAALLWVSCSIK